MTDDFPVTYASSDESIATVDKTSGLVTGVKVGKANITASAGGVDSDPLEMSVVAATVAVTGVTLDKSSYAVTTGATVKAVATVAPDNATDKSVAWSSDAEAVAKVGSDGTITGVKAGTANITVTTTDGKKTATAKVTVSDPTVAVTGVTLDKKDYPVKVGASVTAVATVAPDNATDKSVKWATDNDKIATVDDSGKITGVAAGTANITVTTTDGSKTATATATVSAAS